MDLMICKSFSYDDGITFIKAALQSPSSLTKSLTFSLKLKKNCVVFSVIRKVEAVTKEKSECERLKMEVEAAYRTLQYKHDQESEARRVADALLTQLKEQITRLEEKLAK